MNGTFSPFDALGLPAGNYDSIEVARAFKRAIAVRHPDKQDDRVRWPQAHHIHDARDMLLSNPDAAFERYKGYPQTFFPDHEPYFREPIYPELPDDVLKPEMMQCETCQMVLDCGD
ncbi:hypothetical protein QBC37DRAFT_142249 [Rhypophila decipiens]|uniref:J domain-containing protein n=1 Tax=Rhypophila decipiens TaxID=261697 RepID=A0AAN6XV91_9PEZI|nr:hypothetical protein QBC37DRAFT_142249 [Rhypophila decipiens]